MRELMSSWADESRNVGDGHESAIMVNMGNDLVPWRLGPLEPVICQNCMGSRTMFVTAHRFPAQRGIIIPRDFFLALLRNAQNRLDRAKSR